MVPVDLALQPVFFAIQFVGLPAGQIAAVSSQISSFLTEDTPVFTHQLSIMTSKVTAITIDFMTENGISSKDFSATWMEGIAAREGKAGSGCGNQSADNECN